MADHSNGNGQLPPFDIEAEAGALACILSAADDRQAIDLLSEVASEYFYDERHRIIFQGLTSLKHDLRPVTNVELAQFLKDHNRLEDAGGVSYLINLPDLTPSAHNFPSYLEVIKDRCLRRSILRDSSQVSDLANDFSIPSSTLGDIHQRMSRALPHKNGLPPMVDAAEFMARDIPRPPQLIHGILHRGSKLVLGGGSKSFKTWNLADIAICVSHELPYLGLETTRGRVLYINFEIPEFSWQDRTGSIASAHGIRIDPHWLTFWNLRGHAADYKTLIPKIKEAVKQDFALIIFDPIYKLYGTTDENSAGDVAQLLNSIEELTVESTASVASGAHFSKGNQAAKESIDRISGSGVFARDPDSLLIFTKHEQEDAFTIEATLRNFAPLAPFVVRWQFPRMTRDDNLDPQRLKKPGGRPKLHSTSTIISVLSGQTLSSTEWQKMTNEETGCPKSTFYQILSEVRKQNLAVQSIQTCKWSVVRSRQQND